MGQRRTSSTSFQYDTRNVNGWDDIFSGFDITDPAKQKVVKDQAEKVLLKVNPKLIKYQGNYGQIKLQEHVKKAYDQFPEFCYAPTKWRTLAITKLLGIARSNFLRTKRGQAYIKNERLDRSGLGDDGHRKRKQHVSPDSDNEGPHTIKRRRAEHSDDQDNEEDEDAGDSDDSDALTAGISVLGIQDKERRRAKSATNAADSKMLHLIHCSSGKVMGIVELASISYGPIARWETLVDEVKAYEDLLGSPFTGSLYVSPRDHQNMPVRIQGSLLAALKEVEDGIDVRISTAPRVRTRK